MTVWKTLPSKAMMSRPVCGVVGSVVRRRHFAAFVPAVTVALQPQCRSDIFRPCRLAGAVVRALRTSPAPLAIQQFKLADIGEGIAEVQVTEWFVKEGQMIKEMDNLCTVESDKASVELTSPYTGKIVKIHFKSQDKVKVGAVLVDVDVGGAASPVKSPAAPGLSAPAPSSAAPSGGAGVQQFKLADIGEGIAEVQLVEWFVKEGQKVKEMDRICTVESDKASVELTSPYTGTVTKLHHQVQGKVKVGAALCDISSAVGVGGSTSAAASPAAAQSKPFGGGGSSVKEFKLADIGEGIAQVTITDIFVKEGQMIKEMDNLMAVESDKASVELTSPYTGRVVKVLHKVSEVVKVGSVLVEIETSGGSSDATPAPVAASAQAKTAVSPPPSASTSSSGAGAPGVLAAPKVRALAKEKGIDLNKVTGSGDKGRVLEADVLAFASGTRAAGAQSVSAPVTKPIIAAPTRPTVRPGEDKVVEITDMVGKGMVKSMVESLKIPYMALGEEIDVTELVQLQKLMKDHSLKKYGIRPTITTFLIKAISLALNEYPIINSKFGSIDAPSYTMYGSHNICVAVDSPFGLVVPVIKDVGNLSIIEIQQELMRLAKAAGDNKLALPDIKGGTITFSNVGTIGTKDPRPILYDGQAVIGAAGRSMILPRYDAKGVLEPRSVMMVRWVGDHRHLDGATLARFSNSFKRYVENPGEWLLALR